MKVNNKKNIKLTQFVLMLLIVFSIFLIGVFYFLMPQVDYRITILVFLIFAVSVLKLSKLKIFSLEVSPHFISIKQTGPFSRHIEFPKLEVPLQKITSYKIEKCVINHFFTINIRTCKGERSFCYNLGILSKKQLEQFNNILNPIKKNINHDTRLQSHI